MIGFNVVSLHGTGSIRFAFGIHGILSLLPLIQVSIIDRAPGIFSDCPRHQRLFRSWSSRKNLQNCIALSASCVTANNIRYHAAMLENYLNELRVIIARRGQSGEMCRSSSMDATAEANGWTRAPLRFHMVPLPCRDAWHWYHVVNCVHVHVIRLSVVHLSVCCATYTLLHKIPSAVCVSPAETHGCDLGSTVRRDQCANSCFVRPSGQVVIVQRLSPSLFFVTLSSELDNLTASS